MGSKPKIILSDVSKKYRLYKKKSDRLVEVFHPFKNKFHTEFYALKDLSLKVYEGDVIGILGKNGSGKSTLLKVIAGITTPTTGTCTVSGKVIPLLELGSGFHPELTGRENIYFYSTILGHQAKEINKVVEKIIDFADIGQFIEQPIRVYSSGMKARLAFSVSVFIDPDILIVDEILSVGDEEFRKKSNEKMKELFGSGKTILFVSHSAEAITSLCNKAILLEKGRFICEGTPEEVVDRYKQQLH